MNTLSHDERRLSQRRTVSLSARAKGQENADISWHESTVITTISRTGASFNLQRECPVGQLISLIMPMPDHLRCYDLDKEFYRVWGVVQHCTQIFNYKYSGYHIGIAFIGKHAPASYKSNPLNSYRISGLNELGLWKVYEAERAFISRKHPRFILNLEVQLEILNPATDIRIKESATIENISLSGAAVISSLDVLIGDQLNFICSKPDFFSVAIVRNRQMHGESVSILHLEFIGAEFPIKETLLPIEKVEEVDPNLPAKPDFVEIT